MARNFITADTHNTVDLWKVQDFKKSMKKSLSKEDVLFIAGDFGFPWDGGKQDQYWLKWMDEHFPATIAFVDGNHINFDLLYQFPVIEKWGGKVHKINDSVFHLMRGEFFNINGSSFFTFGGASSIDKARRTEGISWWPQELPTVEEENYAFDQIEKHDGKVDFVITHDAPFEIRNSYHCAEGTSIRPLLKEFKERLKYKRWFFGHHHIDQYYEEYDAVCLYNQIVEIIND